MRMVIEVVRALTWLFRLRPGDPVPHAELDHAHWDRTSRLWIPHGEGGAELEQAA